MYMYISLVSVSTSVLLDCRIVPTARYFCFSFHLHKYNLYPVKVNPETPGRAH